MQGGTKPVTIVSSGNTTNEVWLVPDGTTTFTENTTTKTKAQMVLQQP